MPPRYTIVKRRESADSMYIVAAGEVEVGVHPVTQQLGPGELFGEIVLLKESKRTTTVTTITECQLLVLGIGDLQHLVLDNSDLHEFLTRIMEERLLEIEGGETEQF
ncbi:MAG: cyclic nucleotide-binding domain-containing protein [Rhodospirillales bacterium]|nr:cyclic nucleotide-binding domain-containing protein [Rhodospirillales bacterium]MDP7242440.1 cyclic nucleotide-binding domain-containing protein [Rhodospirillales bacterium]